MKDGRADKEKTRESQQAPSWRKGAVARANQKPQGLRTRDVAQLGDWPSVHEAVGLNPGTSQSW